MNPFNMSSRVYDLAKHLVQVIIPAIIALYNGLAIIYEWTNAKQVSGTLALIATFIGTCLGISAKRFNDGDGLYDGDMVVRTVGEDKIQYSLEFNGDPSTMINKKAISFKVKPESPPVPPPLE